VFLQHCRENENSSGMVVQRWRRRELYDIRNMLAAV